MKNGGGEGKEEVRRDRKEEEREEMGRERAEEREEQGHAAVRSSNHVSVTTMSPYTAEFP